MLLEQVKISCYTQTGIALALQMGLFAFVAVLSPSAQLYPFYPDVTHVKLHVPSPPPLGHTASNRKLGGGPGNEADYTPLMHLNTKLAVVKLKPICYFIPSIGQTHKVPS